MTAQSRVVCYYATWAYGYNSAGQFLPSDLDPYLCTHYVYSFILMGSQGEIIIFDPDFDIKQKGLEDFAALRVKNPDLVTMASIGGWNAGSANFSTVVGNENLRKKFVSNAVTFLKKYELLGLDVDWEYPAQREGAADTDYHNFILLLRELKAAFAADGYVLSAAVAASQENIDKSYNVTALNDVVDFLNVMTYDFHGLSENVTGVNAPLYPQPTDAADTVNTVSASVHAWLNSGAIASKMNLGLGNYGHAYTLVDADDNGTGAPTNTSSSALYSSPYAGDTSSWNYNEICSDQVNNTSQWTIVTGNKNSYVYGVKGNLWIGYDDPNTMQAKGEFARKNGLGGVMFWSVDADDFRGYCGEKWALTKAAKRGYNLGK